ncbi:MAG TPA: SAM-dependent chlorinase/fluorinase [Gaiellaceae bacterium]
MVITFLTDFGLRDDFVGTCHGVIARIAPDVKVIDITHGIEPQAVLQGALVLANTIRYMPEGVHLAVVDPGVGSDRRGLALRDEAGRLYVGPDNGLLVPAAERQGGVAAAWQLTNTAFMLDAVSRTFHGRDVFSPVAAHLAVGIDPAELGPAVEPGSLVRLELPEPEVGGSRIGATVLYVDRYGNVQLNLSRSDMERAAIVPGRRVELDLGVDRYYATAARAFADARPGDIILYEDSYENIAVAITGGNAAEMFGLRPGRRLTIHVAD